MFMFSCVKETRANLHAFWEGKHGENSWKESVCLVLILVYKVKNTNIYLGNKIIIFCEREFGSCALFLYWLFFPFFNLRFTVEEDSRNHNTDHIIIHFSKSQWVCRFSANLWSYDSKLVFGSILETEHEIKTWIRDHFSFLLCLFVCLLRCVHRFTWCSIFLSLSLSSVWKWLPVVGKVTPPRRHGKWWLNTLFRWFNASIVIIICDPFFLHVFHLSSFFSWPLFSFYVFLRNH